MGEKITLLCSDSLKSIKVFVQQQQQLKTLLVLTKQVKEGVSKHKLKASGGVLESDDEGTGF